ncbi:MAG: CRISPR-associated protein Csx19 [Propionibacteriaceae bacterium]|nr:hypothetical protein [Micropruina sp.]
MSVPRMPHTGSLVEALAAADSALVVGFAQSPQSSVFIRREGESLVTPTSDGSRLEPVDLDWIYDLRLFWPQAELHWWWDQREAVGTWSVLNDEAANELRWKNRGTDTRLIRGSVGTSLNGWSRVHDGHSRPLWVPIESQRGARLQVQVAEYTARDTHGNVGVVAERLMGIEESSKGDQA